MAIYEFPSKRPFDIDALAHAEISKHATFGIYIPCRALTNEKIESWRVTNPKGKFLTAERILQITGIERRFVAHETETPFYMGFSAATQAIKNKPKPDALFASTSFPLGFNLSERLSQALYVSPILHQDFFAACSGFPFILNYLKEHEEEFIEKNVLTVTSEKYSPFVYDLKTSGWEKDPSLAQTIFSDGAVALAFKYGQDLTVLSGVNKKFPPEINDCIEMPVDIKLMVNPFIPGPIPPYPTYGRFKQDGKRVIEVVRNEIEQLVEQAVKSAKLDPSKIKMVIPHQGSKPILDVIEKQLPKFRVFRDYHEGNWSSGSIPKAMMRAIENGEIKSGDILVLAGFGAGMLASVAVVKLL